MAQKTRYAAAGLIAGAVTGILGSGGGMLLVPLLALLCKEKQESLFPSSLAIMLSICICSFGTQAGLAALPFSDMIPYLIGGAVGGLAAALLSKRIPVLWLHRVFGILLLWSGFRCLFQ